MDDVKALKEIVSKITDIISNYSAFYNGRELINQYSEYIDKLTGHYHKTGELPTSEGIVKILELLKTGVNNK